MLLAFRICLREHGVHQSFSNPATPHDNAVAEAFFSLLKREDISHNYYQAREDLEKAVANYIEFYNSMRTHRKLHNLFPDDFERSFDPCGDIKAGFKFLIIRQLPYNSRKYDFLLLSQIL